jgi:hypothetical protein
MDTRSSESQIGGHFAGAAQLKENVRSSAASVGASVSESVARAGAMPSALRQMTPSMPRAATCKPSGPISIA